MSDLTLPSLLVWEKCDRPRCNEGSTGDSESYREACAVVDKSVWQRSQQCQDFVGLVRRTEMLMPCLIAHNYQH